MYIVTGVNVKGQRFRKVYDNKYLAMCINLWRGSVWEVQPDGRRKLIKRVMN
jgi:hypothetical protein